MVVHSRDQKLMRLINAATGEVLREDADPIWTDVVDGLPAQLANGDIVWTGISGDTRGLDRRPGRRAPGRQRRSPRPACRFSGFSAPTATTCCSRARPSRPRSASGGTARAG